MQWNKKDFCNLKPKDYDGVLKGVWNAAMEEKKLQTEEDASTLVREALRENHSPEMQKLLKNGDEWTMRKVHFVTELEVSPDFRKGLKIFPKSHTFKGADVVVVPSAEGHSLPPTAVVQTAIRLQTQTLRTATPFISSVSQPIGSPQIIRNAGPESFFRISLSKAMFPVKIRLPR